MPVYTNCLVFFMLAIFCFSSLTLAGDVSLQPPATKSKSVLNAIHSDEVRSIMQRLNTLAYEREYTELELEKLRAEQIELLVQTAGELAQTAENLTDITTQENLNKEDQVTFRAMANQLYNETLKLQEQVKAYDYQVLTPGYDRLRETCNACHRLFRDW